MMLVMTLRSLIYRWWSGRERTVTLVFPPEVDVRISALMARTGSRDEGELIRRALAIYDFVSERHQDGFILISKDPESGEEKVISIERVMI